MGPSLAHRIRVEGHAVYLAVRDPRTPLPARLVGLLVAAYALSPIDLIPDFIPVLGYIDDVLLLPGLIWLAIKLVPPSVLQECRAQGDEWMAREGRKPRHYWGVVLIVAIWAGFAWWLWTLMPR